MHPINKLLSLTSFSVLLVTIERFSFTGKVILQPYSFLRLHEVFQIIVLILLTVIIPFLVLKEVTYNFELLKNKKGFFLSILFVSGIYFYATGNGIHEIASFAFNTYCDTKTITGQLCGGMFFNDYYFGNILYFVGAFFMNITLIFFEVMRPNKNFSKKDFPLLIVNAIIYSFAIFAYAAFDRVLVGLIYSVFTMGAIYVLWLQRKVGHLQVPFTTYLLISYTLGTLASLIVKFH